MTKKRKRLLIGSSVLIAFCIFAIKVQLFQAAYAKIQDAMSGSVTIKFNENKLGDGVADISSDTKYIAYCKGTQEFFVQDLKTSKITTYATKDIVQEVKYSPNGKYLVAGKNVLNTENGQVVQIPTDANLFRDLRELIVFSSDSARIAIFSKKGQENPSPNTVEIWNVQTLELAQTLPVTHIAGMSFSPDGHNLAIASGEEVNIWDIQTGKCVKTFATKSNEADNNILYHTNYEDVAYSPDGKHIAAIYRHNYGKKGTVPPQDTQTVLTEIWDIEQAEVVKTIRWEHDATKLTYSPDGKYVAIGRSVGVNDFIRDAVWIWDINNGQVVAKLNQFPDYHIKLMEYSSDGCYLSVSGAWNAKLWKLK